MENMEKTRLHMRAIGDFDPEVIRHQISDEAKSHGVNGWMRTQESQVETVLECDPNTAIHMSEFLQMTMGDKAEKMEFNQEMPKNDFHTFEVVH